ncbi:hypothetical protein [Streptomyces sp. NPDC090022]|uniref:hypothetical protein n=1 Tax=Streptomyces sp. NPDC090022 TaxID=3365920 RepID=UPI003824CC52
MKQSAAKSLGVAVVGAALAAAAAGTASAAVPEIGPAEALGTVTGAAQGLPLQDVTKSLTGQEQAAGAEGHSTSASDPGQVVGQATGLLGGLPLSNLPVGG